MVIVNRGNRVQCLNADIGSLPTTGVSKYRLLEVCDTNQWQFFNGSSWQILGTNTISPLPSIPGDVSGATNSSLSPTGPFWWNSGDTGGGGGLGTGDTYLPFALTTSTTVTDNGYLPGQRLFEADTGKWFRWDGYSWIMDAAPTTIGGTQEKGGGQITFTVTSATQTVFNIPHGIGAIPSIFIVTPGNVFAIGQSATAANQGFSTTANATNIVVSYAVGVATSTSIILNWYAQD
jgi:hypothetical protein